MSEKEGEKIMNAKDLAQEVASALNNFNFKYDDFVREMSNQHRTLQDYFNILVIKWLDNCKEQYKDGNYDGRNEYRMKLLAQLADEIRRIERNGK